MAALFARARLRFFVVLPERPQGVSTGHAPPAEQRVSLRAAGVVGDDALPVAGDDLGDRRRAATARVSVMMCSRIVRRPAGSRWAGRNCIRRELRAVGVSVATGAGRHSGSASPGVTDGLSPGSSSTRRSSRPDQRAGSGA